MYRLGTDAAGEDVRQLAEEAIALTGAKPTDRVTILGRGQIDLLVEFAHRRFRRVECHAAEGCHSAAEMKADLVVAPSVRDERELMLTASDAGHCLRAGGVFLVRTARALSAGVKRLRDALAAQGFTLVGLGPGCPARRQFTSAGSGQQVPRDTDSSNNHIVRY